MKFLKKLDGIEVNKEDKFVKFIRLSFIFMIFLSIFIVSDLLNGYRNYKYIDENFLYHIRNFIVFMDDAFSTTKVFKTLLFYDAMYLILKGITKKTNLSLKIIYAIFVLFGIINYIVMDTRGVGISFTDILSVKTALSVSNAIKFKFRFRLIVVVLIMIFDYIIFKFIKKSTDDNISIKRRVVYILIGIFIIASFFIFPGFLDEVNLWDINDAYHEYGVPLTLMDSFIFNRIFYNENQYDTAKVIDILSKYEDDVYEEKKYPNILIVLNESFCDPYEIYDFDLKEDYLPFYHSLLERNNIITGTTYSVVFGGGTSLPEYILLTQNDIGVISSIFSPYVQLKAEKFGDTVIKHYKDLKYNTLGIHSYFKTGYNRDNVWKVLGFDKRIFFEDMNLETKNRLDDKFTYEYYYNEMQEKEGHNFSFALTMQNHMPYQVEEEENGIYTETDEELNSYLVYLKKSDDALKELINFVDNYDEKIIMLFLGDHQPNVDYFSKEHLNIKSSGDESAKYLVPFFIYANYDITHEENVKISMQYLQNILCENAGVPLNSYQKYLKSLSEKIPVMTNEYYEDADGNKYKYDDTNSRYYQEIESYKEIVRYKIFK